jgi:hypothetical protein
MIRSNFPEDPLNFENADQNIFKKTGFDLSTRASSSISESSASLGLDGHFSELMRNGYTACELRGMARELCRLSISF